MQTRSHPSRAGYSLVELSIVLVIIGLLTGGILVGRSLIRSAEVQSLIAQKEEYVRAIGVFDQRYNGLPGDLTNATQIWGAADSDADACEDLSTASTGTETCNGNGNRQIAGKYLTNPYERFRAWQHLANAGLITGDYSGVHGPGGNGHAVPGLNSPTGDIDGVGWTVYYIGMMEDDAELFDGSYGHAFFVGNATGGASTRGPFLSVEEAWSLDNKFDDGKPARGFMVVPYAATDCHRADDVDEINVTYDMERAGKPCAILFRDLF